MRRRARIVVAVAALLALSALPAGSQEPIAADDLAWYTSVNSNAGGVPLGDPVANNTLEPGDLPVGAAGTTEHKRTYLLLGVPEGATSGTITLPISETGGTNFGTAGPIVVCPVVEPFIVASGGSIESAPAIDCGENPIVGTPDPADPTEGAATSYQFDVSPLLARWAAGEPNQGIAVVADVREPQPAYQVTFTVELFGTIGSAQSTGTGGGGDDFDPPDFGSGGSGGSGGFGSGQFGSGGFRSGTESSSFAPPPRTDFMPLDDLAFAPAEEAPESASPDVGEPALPVTAQDQAPLASAGPIPGTASPAIWLLLPFALGVLGLSARALGRAGETQSALDRMLGT